MRSLITCMGLCLVLAGCWWSRSPVPKPAPAPVPATPIPTVTAPPDPHAAAITQDLSNEHAAKAKGDTIAELEAEKSEALHRAEQADEAAKQWRAVAKGKDRDIEREHQRILTVKARWVAGILFGASLLGVIVAIWLPLARQWAVRFSAACVAGGTIALVFIVAIPYLPWIGAALIGTFLLAMVVWWRRDHHSLGRVVTAVDLAKNAIPEFGAQYHAIFNDVINAKVSKHIEAVRTNVGSRINTEASALATDAKAEVTALEKKWP